MTAKPLEEHMWFGNARADDDQPADDGEATRVEPPPCAFIVDDEEAICRSIALILAGVGMEAEIFQAAGPAVAALDRRPPSMIFLDIELKGSDAVDVIRGLGERRYRGIVQLMSGSNLDLIEDVRRIGTRHGLTMLAPLAKPFRAEAVRQAVMAAGFDRPPAAPEGFRRAPAMSASLDEALAKGWLDLWYQPKIDLRTRTLVGAEGLIRCRHPIHGTLDPSAFLPDASESSLVALTRLVAVTAMRDWDEMANAGPSLHLAVNTSIGALASTDLPVLIREHRPKSAQWPGLILEVTESDVVEDVSLAHEIATQLRIYGITLAIDDFGEGCSSFARLRDLPFAELKLDRSFVSNCASDAKNAGICRAIVDLAHHFGAAAVAEGLENASDLQAIDRMGCDMGQGFLLARPMPKSNFLAMLQQDTQRRQAS